MDSYALIDCNSFYCSCEQVFDARLAARAIVVLSNNDGCVIARTPEAKALGIQMGEPWFQVRERIDVRRHRVVVRSSNYALYGSMSRRVMEVISTFAPRMEVYSIDEAFLGWRNVAVGELIERAHAVRRTVKRWTGIPVGVGVGKTKTLAKVANRAAKKTAGVCVLDHESAAGRELLEGWPCAEVWGIADRWSRRLAALGIYTAGQLSRANRHVLRKQFGVVLERIVLELGGLSCLALEEVEPQRQNICCSRTFGRPVEDLDELGEAVAAHASRAAEKLRRQCLAASALHVFIHTNSHRVGEPQHYGQAGCELLEPSSFTPTIVGEASRILRAIYRAGHSYSKAGVMCLGLVPNDGRQASLFQPPTRERDEREGRLMAAVDEINARHGRHAIRSLRMGFAQAWKAKASRCSPRYTTRWSDLPRARL